MKPIEEIINDAKVGDLVMVSLQGSRYVGFYWGAPNSSEQLAFPEDHDVMLSGLDPKGTTRFSENDPAYEHASPEPLVRGRKTVIKKQIQFMGINLQKHILGNELIIGYDILERAQPPEEA